ncbi:MAG: MBL fold metallo-hydrolase [Candidatus Pacebacteria bacterium]|nr:MBL fold metallo-hydrolase [Candidatus Paceibacterota bacterium]
MQIIWHGQFCFQILVSYNKNHSVSIVIDPFDKTVGLKAPSLKADLLLTTHNHNDLDLKDSSFLINGAGEYDIKGVYIQAISLSYDKLKERTTFYTMNAEGINICHLGNLKQKELTTEQIEKIGMVDILMIPVGGVETIDGKEASYIIGQIEPKIVIPMYYQIPRLKTKPDGLDKFLKSMGVKSIEPQKKLSIKKKDLVQEKTELILLEC